MALVAGLLPTALILASGRLAKTISEGFGGESGPAAVRPALLALGLFGLVLVLLGSSGALVTYFGHVFTARYVLTVRQAVARAALGVAGIDRITDPAIAEQLAALEAADRTGLHTRTGRALCNAITTRVTGLGAAVVLFTFAWWAPLVLAVGWIAMDRAFRIWMDRLQYGLAEGAQGPLRRTGYIWRLTVEPPLGKELRIFGLGGWLVDRYAKLWSAAMAGVYRGRRSSTGPVLAGVGLLAATHVVVLGALGWEAQQGRINVSSLTVYCLAVFGTFGLGPLGYWQTVIEQATDNARRVRELVEALSETRPPVLVAQARITPDARKTRGEIRFEGVQFAYPGRSRPVLEGLDLVIPAGQSIAVVGENGAGKSTLIRLLCGLATPQAGRVAVDGRDMTCIEPSGWRSQLAVVFQDFIRYPVSLADNVGFGRLTLHPDRAALAEALRRAGSEDLVKGLPGGWDTVLASGYVGGTELSGGQWQRVALARAFLAVAGGAKVLVLDEPTAALDIRAELHVFERILGLAGEVTTVLVSHRLASVRRVERVVLISDGRVAEDGSHDALMKLDGRYAKMFRLQADRYETV
jgi:ATP-binding cassette subfamily B protein